MRRTLLPISLSRGDVCCGVSMVRSSPRAKLSLLSLAGLMLMGCEPQTHEPTVTAEVPAPQKITIQCQPEQPIPVESGYVIGIEKVGRSIAHTPFDQSAAEVVAYDACSDQLLVVNSQAKRVDRFRFDRNGAPQPLGDLSLSVAAKHAGIPLGAATSVAAHRGLLAVSIAHQDPQQRGIIALYRSDTQALVTTYRAGALPDMVQFSADGSYLASANEGQPSDDYSQDPQGSVTLVDLTKGPMQASVNEISFRDFNIDASRYQELDSKVRISGPNASVAQDLEPEYLTFAEDGFLYVALQENNAIAKIDIGQKHVVSIFPLGEKSWHQARLDPSDQDGVIGQLKTYPGLTSLYMPDALLSYQVAGETYLVTANEGEMREYQFQTTPQACENTGYHWLGESIDEDDNRYRNEVGPCLAHTDAVRGSDLSVPDGHPLKAQLQNPKALGRLKLVIPTEPASVRSSIVAFGGRSFSIWKTDGTLVYDSGDELARIALHHDREHFNSDHRAHHKGDARSDEKGIEPEALSLASINGRVYLFIGLERQSGIVIYDVTDPNHGRYVAYHSARDFNQPVCTQVSDGGACENGVYNPAAGDLGPESVQYFSRNGVHYLAVGNEVSGTVTVYRVQLAIPKAN
ncbi:hypothetical protein VST7929_01515 [Vibrio stylophorae]|uniref:Choice-of-anchor I domain-containing protein n=2 Tax=Vibrio stylophorae TaxID=659351 RepID=A0ABN8DTP3_9VIBR|nr:choice-of-anchor I family protein [Vibrio stylophorae]CAH0533644.1 hypothetical protein VST7929_01515 [Vibrio stylophorae]